MSQESLLRPVGEIPKEDIKTSFIGNFIVAFKYVMAETKKSKRSFLVGCTTVMLVVFANSLLENTIEYAPVLFLKLAEDSVGEYDLVLTAKKTDPDTFSFFVNGSDVARLIDQHPEVQGVAPRWLMLTSIQNTQDDTKNTGGASMDVNNTSANIYVKNTSAIMLIIDSKNEQAIGLGRAWKHPPLQGYSCHMSKGLLRLLGVRPNNGESIIMKFDLFTLLHTMSGSADPEIHFIREALNFFINATKNQNSTGAPGLDLASILRPFLPGFNVDYIASLLQGPALQTYLNDYLKSRFGISLENMNDASNLTDNEISSLKEALSMSIGLEVIDSIDEPEGKYPSAVGNAIILEIDLWNTIIRAVATKIVENVTAEMLKNVNGLTPDQQKLIFNRPTLNIINNFVQRIDIREYALTVIVMYRNRFSAFLKDKRGLEHDIVNWSNGIIELLGINYPVSVQAPLIEALRILYYLRLFLDQILLLVEVFLVGLGMLLIYSLLLADVEGKVYECGMLRALGMQQYTLIQLLVIQSLLFSIPGIASGLNLSLLAFIPIGGFFSSYSGVPITLSLTWTSAGLGVVVGFVMPLVALIGPVQRALSKTLRDALDLYHSLSSDTEVKFVSLEKMGISTTQTYMSILGVCFGFIIYYLIPYSFIFFYWALFFNIFVGILLAMVLGLALIGMIIHPLTQMLSVNLLMWGPDRTHLKSIVQKNLSGHGLRNSKTSILFTICIAFIIFAGTIFNQQAHNMESTAKLSMGSDIVFAAMRPTLPLDRPTISNYLDLEMKRPGSIVKGYAYTAFPISQYASNIVDRTDLGTLADYALSRVLVFGVDKNYLDVTYDEYVEIKEFNKNFDYELTPHGNKDIIRSLVDHNSPPTNYPRNSELFTNKLEDGLDDHIDMASTYSHPIDVIVSEAMRFPSSIDTSTPVEIRATIKIIRNGNFIKRRNFYFLASVRAMVSGLPGFLFSSYSQTALLSPIIVSMDDYKYLLHSCYNYSYAEEAVQFRPEEPPIHAIFIKVEESSGIIEREDIINALKTYIPDEMVFIVNTKDLLKSTDTAILILNVFFDVVSLIVIILCFFLLFVSFTTNINENAWEFGVLRAVGMTAWQVIRVYIYEAMSIVLASVLIGFFIGDLVSVTLALQACLWSELPFTFQFPIALFSGVVVMSILVAIFGSYLPARGLQKKRIASALKNL